MPSNRPATIRTDTLPEFLRSPAVGAIIAEALDSGVVDGGSGAVADMVRAAAAEIRQFHELPLPSHQQGTAPRLVTDFPERDMDEWTRTEPEADQG